MLRASDGRTSLRRRRSWHPLPSTRCRRGSPRGLPCRLDRPRAAARTCARRSPRGRPVVAPAPARDSSMFISRGHSCRRRPRRARRRPRATASGDDVGGPGPQRRDHEGRRRVDAVVGDERHVALEVAVLQDVAEARLERVQRRRERVVVDEGRRVLEGLDRALERAQDVRAARHGEFRRPQALRELRDGLERLGRRAAVERGLDELRDDGHVDEHTRELRLSRSGPSTTPSQPTCDGQPWPTDGQPPRRAPM